MTPRELSKEEVESFERYAKENEVELDGTQSQWADYTLRLIAMLRQSQAECERLNGELSKPDAMSGITIAGLTAECERLKGDNKKLAYDVAHLVVGRDETISRLTRDLVESQKENSRLARGLEDMQRHKFLLAKELDTAQIGLKGLTRDLAEAQRKADALDKLEEWAHKGLKGLISEQGYGSTGIYFHLTKTDSIDGRGSETVKQIMDAPTLLEAIEKASAGK